MSRPLLLGTRGSQLALIQSNLVADRVRAAGRDVELVRIVTEGDVRPVDVAIGDGIFVAAIAAALRRGEIDLAVHSAKDVPLEEEAGLLIGAFPERADPRDVLVTRTGGASLASLAEGAVVGTDSPRRAGFLRASRPDLRVVPLHGNVDTRLRRLDAGEVDALVLAAAGLDRLGRSDRIDARFEPEVIAPAPGQGALAIQARSADVELREILASIDEPDVRLCVESERAVLAATGGGCRAPVGALATVAGARLSLFAAAVTPDGGTRHSLTLVGSATASAGRSLAAEAGVALLARVELQ